MADSFLCSFVPPFSFFRNISYCFVVRVSSAAPFIGKIAKDSNAIALGTGLSTILAFFQKAPSVDTTGLEGLATSLVTKGLKVRQANIAQDILVLMLGAGEIEPTIDALVKGCANRVRKIPPLCVSCLCKGFKEYGGKSFRPFLPKLSACIGKLFSNANPKIREEATNLATEINRWFPGSLKAMVDSLRPMQQKELNESFEKAKALGRPVADKTKRNREAAAASAGMNGEKVVAVAAEVDEEPEEFDPYETAPTIDLMAKLAKTEYSTNIVAEKWAQRKNAFNSVLTICTDIPKLRKDADYSSLVADIRKVLKRDKNVQVNVFGVKVIGALASGLRKAFSSQAQSFVSPMLAKLKEKSRPLIAAVKTTMALVLQHCVPLMKLDSEFEKNTGGKALPQMREHTMDILTTYLKSAEPKVKKEELALSTKIFMGAILDANPKIREPGKKGMVFILNTPRLAGKKLVQDHMKTLEEKNARAFKALNKCIAANANAGTGKVKTKKSTPSKMPRLSSRSQRIKKSSPKPKATTASRGKKSVPQPTADDDNVPECAIMDAQESIDAVGNIGVADWSTHLEALNASAWKDKMAAYEAVSAAVVKMDKGITPHLNAVFSFFFHQSRKFKVSNFNLARAIYAALSTLSLTTGTQFGKSYVSKVVVAVTAKIGDRKQGSPICAMLQTFSEHSCGPSFVLKQVIKGMAKVRSPLAMTAALAFMEECVKEFGGVAVNAKMLLDYCNSDKGLKARLKVPMAATKVLSQLYHHLGPKFKKVVRANVDDKTFTGLDAEFEKIGYDSSLAAATKKTVGGDNEEAALTLEIETVDIAPLISAKLKKQLGNTEGQNSWKKRSAALDEVLAILQPIKNKGNPIQLNKGSVTLMRCLKERICEKVIVIKRKGLQAVSLLVGSLEASKRAKIARIIAVNIMDCLADKKTQIVESCIQALDNFILEDEVVHPAAFGSLIKGFTKVLMIPATRNCTLTWMEKYVPQKGCQSLGKQLVELMPGLMSCLQDKKSGIRSSAMNLIMELMRADTKSAKPAFLKSIQEFKPAAKRQLADFTQKVKNFTSSGTPNTASAPAPVAKTKEPEAKKVKLGKTAGESNLAKKKSRASKLVRPRATRREKKSEPVPDGDAITTICSKKDTARRVKRDARKKWWWEPTKAPREDLVEVLTADLQKYVSATVHKQLFSKSVPDHIKAMQALGMAIESQPDGIVSIVDLLLKWCTVRMCWRDNTQAIAGLHRFMLKLVSHLADNDFPLTDTQAAALFPFLIEKAGHKLERFRKSSREILCLLRRVFPASKIAPYLVEGFQNTANSKTKAECLAELFLLVQECGSWKICSGKKGIRSIKAEVGSSDPNVRKGALDILAVVWGSVDGEWKQMDSIIGKATGKIRSLMEERFKFSNENVNTKANNEADLKKTQQRVTKTPTRANAKPADSSSISSPAQPDEFGDMFNLQDVTVSPLAPTPSRQMTPVKLASVKKKKEDIRIKEVKKYDLEGQNPQKWSQLSQALQHIRQFTENQKQTTDTAAAGLKFLYYSSLQTHELAAIELISAQANDICDTIVPLLELGIQEGAVEQFRLVSLALSVLMTMISSPEIAVCIGVKQVYGVLKCCICSMLVLESRGIISDGSGEVVPRTRIFGALNSLAIRLASTVGGTQITVTILNLFRDTFPGRETALPAQTSDIALKLLAKLLRADASVTNLKWSALDTSDIVEAVARTYKVAQTHASTHESLSLAAIKGAKTILKQLALAQQADAQQEISRCIDSGSPLYLWIFEECFTVAAEKDDASDTINAGPSLSVAISELNVEDSESEPPQHAISLELTKIFRKITEKDKCAEGLQELFRFRQQHSDVDIAPYMKNTTKPFQKYIEGELAKLGQKKEETNENTSELQPQSLKSRLEQMRSKYRIKPDSPTASVSTTTNNSSTRIEATRMSLLNMRQRLAQLTNSPAKPGPSVSSQTSVTKPPTKPPVAPRSGLAAPRSGLTAPRSGLVAPRSGLAAPRSGLAASRSSLSKPTSLSDLKSRLAKVQRFSATAHEQNEY